MFLQSKQLLSFEYANACKGILFNGPSGITIILSYLLVLFCKNVNVALFKSKDLLTS